ncbi:MAG TPA: hypothetical protein VIJ15_13215, partial [Dermatophilaceae bacterium]
SAAATWTPRPATSDVTTRTPSLWSFLDLMTPPPARTKRARRRKRDRPNGTQRGAPVKTRVQSQDGPEGRLRRRVWIALDGVDLPHGGGWYSHGTAASSG